MQMPLGKQQPIIAGMLDQPAHRSWPTDCCKLVVPGTLRDSLFLLAVVLEQQTELNPTKIMTDTGAYTDVVFGLFWLLGYRFSPRIADIGGVRYWRIHSSADYGPFNCIARHRVNTNLIRENWDDLLRLAGSLQLGLVQATSIMRTPRVDDRPTRLAQAVAELGPIDKTVHGLMYVDDESKRRRTLTQLNRGEDRHKLACLPRQTGRTTSAL
jgi:TnpA family transposase